jgi:hypothetical protein
VSGARELWRYRDIVVGRPIVLLEWRASSDRNRYTARQDIA